VGQRRLLYSSENGDRWLLVRGSEPERVLVRQEPNAASGGQATELKIAEFLIRGVYGPEHFELLRLITPLWRTADVLKEPPVDVFQRRRHWLAVVPRHEIQAVPEEIDNAGLHGCLREYRQDRLGNRITP